MKMKTEMDIDALIAIVLAIDCHSLRQQRPPLLSVPLLPQLVAVLELLLLLLLILLLRLILSTALQDPSNALDPLYLPPLVYSSLAVA